jgi:hypothetical protein
MSTPAVAYTSIEAEVKAAEAEGTFIPTEDEQNKIKRHRALSARADKIAAEMEAIENDLQKSMSARGALRLAVNGKNLVQWAKGSKRVLDSDAMLAAHPTTVALYNEAREAYQAVATAFTSVVTTPYGSFRIKK